MLETHHIYFIIKLLIFVNILKAKLPIYMSFYFAYLKCKYLGTKVQNLDKKLERTITSDSLTIMIIIFVLGIL